MTKSLIEQTIEQIHDFSKRNPTFKLVDPNITFAEFSQLIPQISPEQAAEFKKITGLDMFFQVMVLGNCSEYKEVFKILFNHAKRLGFDPNSRYEMGTSANARKKNTPLHVYLANEDYHLVIPFIEASFECEVPVNLNLADVDGKTPMMLAIKLANVPIDVIKKIITSENCNKADKTGVTPFMMACAMRRVDIMKELIQYHATQLKMGPLNFKQLTLAQKSLLADFINYQEPNTGKSSGHYSVMRQGTVDELSKSDDYQLTIMNIAKSVGIDARRDENALMNTPIGGFPQQFESYSGTSFAEAIVKRTESTVEFLSELDFDFSLKQKSGNRTPADYIANLKLKEHESLVTEADKKYIFPLEQRLTELTKKLVMNKIPQRVVDIPVHKVCISETKLEECEKILIETTLEDMQFFDLFSGGITLFHSLFSGSPDSEKRAKINLLCKHAKRLNLDPNAHAHWNGQEVPYQYRWKNTPIHLYLGNECFTMVSYFLESANQYGLSVNLNIKDIEGKTQLMLAIKLGNTPIEIIRQLMTKENYNQPDDTSVSPLMMACAMRRVDIMKEIIQYHAMQLGIGTLNFSQLTSEQKQLVADFINAQDKITGKALAHYAVMRHGTEDELTKKPDTYQLTVLNIAKSVGIDARRDANAKTNSPANDTGAPVSFSTEEINFYNNLKQSGNLVLEKINLEELCQHGFEQNPKYLNMKFTELSYRGPQKLEHAILASKENSFSILSKIFSPNAHVYTKIESQVRSYCGSSCAESVLKRTQETINFLTELGHDFSLQQKDGNKTAAAYIANLTKEGNAHAVTDVDRKYLFPLVNRLNNLVNSSLEKVEENPFENH